MTSPRRFLHLLDDLAMGGVTRALQNFDHPDLVRSGNHEIIDINRCPPQPRSNTDIALVHFTLSWQKMPRLFKLRMRRQFAKIILIEHTYTEGFELSEVEAPRRFHRMLKSGYGLVDQIVAVSQAQRDWIVASGLAPAHKVTAIPQSRDCQHLLQLPLAQRRPGPLRIGAFGRFHRQKGFDLLLEAMARIPPEQASLKLAGTGDEACDLSERATLLPHVEILPAFQSPERFLQSVDVVAIPSRWEAFGLVGVEARAAGRPIIAAQIDGLKDQLGSDSFSHRMGDVADLRRAIMQAVHSRQITQRGHRARERARPEFDRMIEGWRNVLAA